MGTPPRIEIPGFCYALVDHCILTCHGCDHDSPLAPSRFTALEQFERDLKTLSEVMHAHDLRLGGGEPLLHPQVEAFFEIARKSQVADRLTLVTNGLLLHKCSPRLWTLIDGVYLSRYPGVSLPIPLSTYTSIAKDNGVYLDIADQSKFIHTLLNQKIEYPELIAEVYRLCKMTGEWWCHTVHEGRYYKCSVAPFSATRMARIGVNYNPIVDSIRLDSNPNLRSELEQFLRRREPLTACAYCLGTSGPEEAHHLMNPQGVERWWKEDHSQVIKKVYSQLLGRRALGHSSNNFSIKSDVFKVTAIIAMYNEEDIIATVVDDLISEGIHVHILDDGSTDASLAQLSKFSDRGMLTIESVRSPLASGETRFCLESIMRRKELLAGELDSDWFINADADEFRESPWTGVSLMDGIRRVDSLGYNAIDFAVLDFVPTNDEFRPGDDPREAFPYFEPGPFFNKVQIRCWKKSDHTIDLVSSGGHEAIFPGRKVFPIRFILRHYPFRGQAQAERKLFRDRRPRYPEEEKKLGWHIQYNDISEGHCFIRKTDDLERYDPDRIRIGLQINNRELEALWQSVALQQGELEMLKQTVELQQHEAENLRHTVALQQGELQNFKKTIGLQQGLNKDLASQLNLKSRNLQAVNLRLLQLEGRLNLMYRSLSWRITAPLRRMGAQFPRLLNWATRIAGGTTIPPSAPAKTKDHPAVGRVILDKIVEAKSAPGSIGIHLHLFYMDLLDEIAGFLSNIPYPFHLYISITDKSKSSIVQEKLQSLNHATACTVKVIPNRGRNIAPFVVHFADEMLKNDFICHIHSKKSLYTGVEQTSLRKHFYNNLLWSPSLVRKIFGIFNTYQSVGIIYPETYSSLPYWAHTWLHNKEIGRQLSRKFQVFYDPSGYLDAPLGAMFWARVEALRPLLSSGFTAEDFPEENNQTDGTLAHAIERIMVPIALRQGYTFCEINAARNDFSVSFGSRNLFQYWGKSLDGLKSAIRQHQLISFDIFDTLITRPILDPDAVFDLLSIEVEQKNGIHDFSKIRKAAETEIRNEKRFDSDVDIDDIYRRIGLRLKLDKATIDRWCSREKELELRLNLPRSEVVEAFRYARENDKRIVLMSDMYLDKATVEALLKKNGIEGYEEIFLSSSMGVRKDNAGMWLKLLELYPGLSILHIGDNEHSDVQIPCDMGVSTYHVMTSKNMFMNSETGRAFPAHALSRNIADSALLGLSLDYLFNNPFALHDCKGDYIFSDKFSFGYAVLGPVVFAYLLWLLKSSLRDHVSKILFLAREGFLLKRIFDMILTDKEVADQINSKIETIYLHASRRAATVPVLNNLEDAVDLLKKNYMGTLYNLMESRFGLEHGCLEEKCIADSYVELPTDHDKVAAVLREQFDTIAVHALQERNYYIKYLESKGIKSREGNIAVSDLGYSGSIQNALSKLLDVPLRGYYFATCFDIGDNDNPGNRYSGYFADNEDPMTTESAVYRYSLVLESILTSPDGQLVSFEERNGEVLPVFKKPNDRFNSLLMFHEGITNYCRDMLKNFGPYLLNFQPESKIVEYLLGKVLTNHKVAEEIISDFKVEDQYCSDGDILSI